MHACANGHQVAVGTKFCGSCGSPVAGAAAGGRSGPPPQPFQVTGGLAGPPAAAVGRAGGGWIAGGRLAAGAADVRRRAITVSWSTVVSILAGTMVGMSLGFPWVTGSSQYLSVSLTLWQVGQLSPSQQDLTSSISPSDFYGLAALTIIAALLLVTLPLVLGARPRRAATASVAVAASGLLLVGGVYIFLMERAHGTPDGPGFVVAVVAFLVAIIAGMAGLRAVSGADQGRPSATTSEASWQ